MNPTYRSFLLSRSYLATRRHDLQENHPPKEDGVALYRMRRRLLRFILENHRQRVAERGLSQQPSRQPA